MTGASPSHDATIRVRDHCLCLHTQRAARALARRFDEALRPFDLTNGQFSLLMSLNRPEAPPMTSVARLLGMDRTTLTAALKPLERRGLALGAADPMDRRARLLRLTDDGRALLARALPTWEATHEAIEGTLADPNGVRAALKTLSDHRGVRSMQKISPFLWYVKEAEEAARFYASIFPESSVDAVNAMPTDSPSGPAGSVVVVKFTLFGQSFMAMSAGPHDPFNDAVSLYVDCADQAEVDRYWNALEADGGKPQACGWIRDRYGVRWQIVPRFLTDAMTDPDPVRGKRVADAMMTMVKIDVAALEAAARG